MWFFPNDLGALPPALSRKHNVFHISMLCKYARNPSHLIRNEPLQIKQGLTYEDDHFWIIKKQHLHPKKVQLVKILWKDHSMERCTSEHEAEMRETYPHLFENQGTYNFEDEISQKGREL